MKKAFTLAEVLITLTIIGVIAALTIPNLMQKWEVQQYETAVKKTYTTLSAGFNIILKEYSYSEFKSFVDSDIENLSRIIKTHFKVAETCTTKCPNHYNYRIKRLKGGYTSGTGEANTFLSQSGDFLFVKLENDITFVIIPISNEFVYLRIDTNSPDKGPNTFGKDVFKLSLTAQGMLFPDCSMNYCKEVVNQSNIKTCTEYWKNKPYQCGKVGVKLKNDNTSIILGQNCIARIMENGWEMDYLK